MGEFSRQAQAGKANEGHLSQTDRELEVLRFVTKGETNKEIASKLTISESTVKYHLRNILDKLHLDNPAQVKAFAASRGLGGDQQLKVRPKSESGIVSYHFRASIRI